jgi:beta-lysine 5,6-aminomutase alpha subunit
MREKLGLSKEKIAEARELASRICAPVLKFVDEHTSVTVERATLRLAGADDADADGVPVPNLIVEQARDALEDGPSGCTPGPWLAPATPRRSSTGK